MKDSCSELPQGRVSGWALATGGRGFSLVELLVALALSATIVGAASAVLRQLSLGYASNRSQLTAFRQVQNAGYWVSRDVFMAQQVQPGPGAGFPLTLAWTEWDGTSYQVVYTLEPLDGLGRLVRTQRVGFEAPVTTSVAQYLDPAGTTVTWEPAAQKVTLQVTARVGERSQTRTYETRPRPSF